MQTQAGTNEPDPDQRFWAMLCHLSALSGLLIPFANLLGPLLIWLFKKEEMPFVRAQGKEAVNFQLSFLIALLVAGLLVLVVIGAVLLPLLLVGWLVLVVVAGMNASEGVSYRYPFSLRLIR